DSAMTVRGRFRFAAQVGRRFGVSLPAEVAYDDFTEDIEENRLLKAALTRLLRMSTRRGELRRPLHAFQGLLLNVSSVDYDPRALPVIHFDRLNERYRHALSLAQLVLRSAVLEFHPGALRASGFLVDMSDVFESFVATPLGEALGLPTRAWRRE